MSQQFIASLQPYRGGKAFIINQTVTELLGAQNPSAKLAESIRASVSLEKLADDIKKYGFANNLVVGLLPQDTDMQPTGEPDEYRLTLPAGELLTIVDGARRLRIMLDMQPDQPFQVAVNISGGVGFEAIEQNESILTIE